MSAPTREDQLFKTFIREVLPNMRATNQIAQWAEDRGVTFSEHELGQIEQKQVQWLIRERSSADEALELASQRGIELTDKARKQIERHFVEVAFSRSPAARVYYGSNGGATRKFCTGLEKNSRLGKIAAQLFRTQKASTRAKNYRGGISVGQGRRVSYRELAYDRKAECMEVLCDLLAADDCGLSWGWGYDTKTSFAPHVLYVELPQGQVSFHSKQRFVGPDYGKKWDGQEASERRILNFCNSLIGQA